MTPAKKDNIDAKEVKETSKKIKKEERKSDSQETEKVEVPKEDKTLDNDGRVGTMLRETRLKKGETLEEIAQKLRIREAYLSSIENSNYSEVPEAPYGLGFVRSYAAYLGLNAVRMSQLYKEETDSKNPDSELYVPEPETEATAPKLKYIIISLLIIAGAYFGWNYYIQNYKDLIESKIQKETNESVEAYPLKVENDKAEEEKTLSQASEEALPIINADSSIEKETKQVVMTNESFSEEVIEDGKAKVEEAKKESSAKAEEQPSQIAEKEEVKEEVNKEENNKETTEIKTESPNSIDTDVKVVMKTRAETWIEAKDADKLYISKVVEAGYTYNVPDAKGMIISAGRYDAVDVYVFGKKTPVFTADKKTGIKVDEIIDKALNH